MSNFIILSGTEIYLIIFTIWILAYISEYVVIIIVCTELLIQSLHANIWRIVKLWINARLCDVKRTFKLGPYRKPQSSDRLMVAYYPIWNEYSMTQTGIKL